MQNNNYDFYILLKIYCNYYKIIDSKIVTVKVVSWHFAVLLMNCVVCFAMAMKRNFKVNKFEVFCINRNPKNNLNWRYFLEYSEKILVEFEVVPVESRVSFW